ncbi:MAG: hypothetical protein R6U21_02730 [Thermoplasmatota archaeon]
MNSSIEYLLLIKNNGDERLTMLSASFSQQIIHSLLKGVVQTWINIGH